MRLSASPELPDFINKIRGLLEEQRHEVERALISTGEYRLRDEYRYLQVESSSWFKISLDQRQRKISRFMKAPVEVSSNRISLTENPINTLNLPENIRDSMWEKAQDLARDETSIVKAPGSENGWMIKSYSNKQPHYVRLSNSGGISCDDLCLSYKSLKICSHTLALAVKEIFISKLLKWYHTQKVAPNYTALSESGKSKATGKKCHVRELLRSSLNRSRV